MYVVVFCVFLSMFNEETYLTFKSIFHKALNLFEFDCEITLESVPGTNQLSAITVKFLAQGNNGVSIGLDVQPMHHAAP